MARPTRANHVYSFLIVYFSFYRHSHLFELLFFWLDFSLMHITVFLLYPCSTFFVIYVAHHPLFHVILMLVASITTKI